MFASLTYWIISRTCPYHDLKLGKGPAWNTLNTVDQARESPYVSNPLPFIIMEQLTLTPEQIKLVNILEQFFKKADCAQVPHLYSTTEVFSRIQSVHPSQEYTTYDIYQMLLYKEYEFINATSGKICWLIQEKI